ncbi:hypothetical protein [Glutamicibacter ardleyensis]|uniref:hypothetical protein n=1 Tax=Glutamicibacter ardleyensis TaxID=225894 RepID=UPI003FD2ACC6
MNSTMAESRLVRLVNNDEITIAKGATPITATPAAFVAGMVAGAKAAGALVAAAGVGAAVGKAVTN